jgi:hypothetical protein
MIMSIATQLIKAKNNLDNSRKTIVYKGGTVGEVAKFDNLASEIASIPSGDVNYLLVDDTDTAYRKQILAGASPLAKIKSVGGMTYKCNNLIPFPYTYASRDLYGINFTVNNDGTVTLNGTFDSDDERDFILAENLYLPAGTYTLSGISSHPKACYMFGWIKKADGSMSYPTKTITLEQGDYILRLTIRFNANLGTVSNLVVKPMLNEGETALPYEPYFEGLRDTKVTSLVSHGKNFLPDNVKDASSWVLDAKNNGDYYLDLPDGWYCINLKVTEDYPKDSYFYLTKSTNGGMNYTVTKACYRGIDGMETDGYLITPSGVYLTVPCYFKVDNKAGIVYRLRLSEFKPSRLDYFCDMQIEAVELEQEPSASYPPATYAPTTEYVPYKGIIDTVAIPEAVQAFEGYGTTEGRIDFERKVWIYGDNETDISEYLTDDNYIEVEGGGTITAVNEHENAVPFNIAYIRRTT